MPLALILLVIALHFWIVWVGPLPGDRWALRQGWTPHPTWVHDYADFFQHVGTPLVAILLVAVALVLILRYASLREACGLVIACCAVPLNALFKLVFGPSPLWAAAHHGGHNYPSGHVTFVTAVIGYLGVIAWRHERRWLAAIAALFVIGVGPARVLTGIHLVSDVIGGYLLGAAMLLAAQHFTTDSVARQDARALLRGSRLPVSSR